MDSNVHTWMNKQMDGGTLGKCVYKVDGSDELFPYTHEMFCDEFADRLIGIIQSAGWKLADANTFKEDVGYIIHDNSVWTESRTNIIPTYVILPSLAKESLAITQRQTSWTAQKLDGCWSQKKTTGTKNISNKPL